jgi:hypothetical protein
VEKLSRRKSGLEKDLEVLMLLLHHHLPYVLSLRNDYPLPLNPYLHVHLKPLVLPV